MGDESGTPVTTGTGAPVPTCVVPPTATYHGMTAVLAAVVLVAAVTGLGADGWPRWFLAVICVAGLVVVVNRARARVVVTADRIDVGHELGTRRIARGDLQDLQTDRDGLGWAPQVVRRDGTHLRIECLAAFQREGAELALGELRAALDSIPSAGTEPMSR